MEDKSSTQKSSQGQTVRIQAARKQRARKKAFMCEGQTWQAHPSRKGTDLKQGGLSGLRSDI